jgi:3-dehydroquinate synthase
VNRVALSLDARGADECLQTLRGCASRIGLCELCVDRLPPRELEPLLRRAPCPVIVTCRPKREGGSFDGSERERLEILRRALALGCDFVDIEWDAIDGLGAGIDPSRLIVSRHWFAEMPPDLLAIHGELKGRARVVKLAGTANRLDDTLPVLALLAHATMPVIAIAMGGAGRLTRLVAPLYSSCFLTFGCAGADRETAAGQVPVSEMCDTYGLDAAGPETELHLHLGGDGPRGVPASPDPPGRALHVPLPRSASSAFLSKLLEVLPSSSWVHRATGADAAASASSSPAAPLVSMAVPIAAEPVASRIIIGEGVVQRGMTELLEPWKARRPALVTDDNVRPMHADRLAGTLRRAGFDPVVVSFPPGEASKAWECAVGIYRQLLGARIERGDPVIAVGGGVVGDIAGFVASTLHRGVPFVNVPTTLVAMVSASVGGKTGINFDGAKNLVGAFHNPALVVIDPSVCRTLPAAEVRAGLGEMLTVGMIGDRLLFEALERGESPLAVELIARAVRVKRGLVARDPFDLLDERAKLNLGHTFGHAFEAVTSFELSHGLAVALGLRAATVLAASIRLCPPDLPSRVSAALERLRLPTTLAGHSAGEVVAAMSADKKRRAGKLRFVLPEAPGRVRLVRQDQLPRGAVEAALGEVLTGRG